MIYALALCGIAVLVTGIQNSIELFVNSEQSVGCYPLPFLLTTHHVLFE